MAALVPFFSRTFLGQETSEGQQNVGSSLTLYETIAIGERVCLSICLSEVASYGDIVFQKSLMDVSHVYSSVVRYT